MTVDEEGYTLPLTAAQIRETAMRLPPKEREEMAEAPIASLPRDLAMEATIERRYEELRTGKVKGIPAEDMIEELEKLVR